MKNIPIIAFALTLLFQSNTLHAQKSLPSGKILAEAYQKAAKEKKNVLIVFKASWCGWCKKMIAAINDESCRELFNKYYVITELSVDERGENKNLENVGADIIRKKHKGERAGLPFWLIMDKDGKMLEDSYMRKEGQSADTPGESIGCPASDEEVAAFCYKLKNTSKLSDQELLIITERFKKNR
jgi:thioredoxin-related protein